MSTETKLMDPKNPNLSNGVELVGDLPPGGDQILTPEALGFVADLERQFGAQRKKLLERRQEIQARLDQGAKPDFLASTADVRAGDWKVAPAPKDLQDRRVEITGPVERKMIINALNSGAKVFMADLEDSLAPTWRNVVEGQINLRDAVRGDISFDDPKSGKHYELAEKTAVLIVRPRGWHFEEVHMRVDGAPVSAALFDFAFYYPLFMSYLWMTGAIYYFFYREHVEKRPVDDPPRLPDTPGVTFIVPCHNEARNVRDTIRALLEQDYPDFEVIAVNDASTDDTGEILEAMAEDSDQLRVIHLATNQGKAMGLRVATIASNNEILVCVDGDAILERHATRWLVRHFANAPRVGAVTGNPRVRNRTTLLGKIQVGEFSSIVGLIKRAQRICGRVFTVSGVVAAFRKSALHAVGYWNLDMVTEDIDVSWSLQLDQWDVRYEPNALCYILMPETLDGLWRQRVRWAQGGVEVLKRHLRELLTWRNRRM
ncbi:MAG: poly-beta-1,6 N-acetyl-D-glucosamine synthase, partial [Proteobacteria bacterium]|nr:poly-beta-1,6 N-acetyl-D-glucosamine synthase [Pseudomonadota bacterium]